jgi:hypothetical protein
MRWGREKDNTKMEEKGLLSSEEEELSKDNYQQGQGGGGGAEGEEAVKVIAMCEAVDDTQGQGRHVAIVAPPYPATPYASVSGMSCRSQEEEEERTIEQEEDAGRMSGVQK